MRNAHLPDDFKKPVQAVLDQALHGEETANFEFPLLTKAGIRLDVLLNATTRRNEQGNIIGVVGIGQDITGRLAQEREYTRLIDTANAPIFGVNQYGRVNVWNKVSFGSNLLPTSRVSSFWAFILPWHKAHDKYTHTCCFPFLYMIIYSSDR